MKIENGAPHIFSDLAIRLAAHDTGFNKVTVHEADTDGDVWVVLEYGMGEWAGWIWNKQINNGEAFAALRYLINRYWHKSQMWEAQARKNN